jgi:hypothetical protein
VIEYEGLKWKPARGCSSTWDEFLETRSLFMKLHADAQWNHWTLEDRATDLDEAVSIMDQWTRVEPNFRPRTAKQLDADLASVRQRFEAKRARTVRLQ